MKDYSRERKNKKSKNSFTGIAVILAVLLVEALAGADGGFIGVLAVIIFIGIVGFAVAYALAKKKSGAKQGSVYHMERAKEKAKHYFMREEFEEEAIKCTHPRGREKYIHQLDNFLANGIIDKDEYRVLKDRYDKLNVADNMH